MKCCLTPDEKIRRRRRAYFGFVRLNSFAGAFVMNRDSKPQHREK